MERILYRMENAFVVIVGLYVFLIYGTTWTGFLLFLALPKYIYLIPEHWYKGTAYEKIHQFLDSILHSYSTVMIVSAITFLFMNVLLWSILGWVIHIAIDRVIKYKEKQVRHPLFEVRG